MPVRQEDSRASATADVAELQARLEALERHNEDLRMVAAAAAHDLMVPLIAIEGHASGVAERVRDGVDDDARRQLEALLRATTRMRVLLETLLRQSRALRRTSVELGHVVDDCVALLSPEIAARGARVMVKPLPTVCADAGLLSSVFQNLVSNGLRHGSRNRSVIRISAARAEGSWRIAVESEGRPLDAADRSRIFDPFVHGAGERRAEGAGVGLAICRMIIERHGGTIGVEPLPHGNRFFFTLPD